MRDAIKKPERVYRVEVSITERLAENKYGSPDARVAWQGTAELECDELSGLVDAAREAGAVALHAIQIEVDAPEPVPWLPPVVAAAPAETGASWRPWHRRGWGWL